MFPKHLQKVYSRDRFCETQIVSPIEYSDFFNLRKQGTKNLKIINNNPQAPTLNKLTSKWR